MATPAAVTSLSSVDKRLAREAAREAAREVETSTPVPQPEEKPVKSKGAYQKRIDQLIRQRFAADEHAAQLQARVAELEAEYWRQKRLLDRYRDELRRYRAAYLKLKEARHVR